MKSLISEREALIFSESLSGPKRIQGTHNSGCGYKKPAIWNRWFHRHSKSQPILDTVESTLPHVGKRQRFKRKFKSMMAKLKRRPARSDLNQNLSVCVNQIPEKIETPEEVEARLNRERMYKLANRYSLANYPEGFIGRNDPARQWNVNLRPYPFNEYPFSYFPMNSYDVYGYSKAKTFEEDRTAIKPRVINSKLNPADSSTNRDNSYIPVKSKIARRLHRCTPPSGQLVAIRVVREPEFTPELHSAQKKRSVKSRKTKSSQEKTCIIDPKKKEFHNKIIQNVRLRRKKPFQMQPRHKKYLIPEKAKEDANETPAKDEHTEKVSSPAAKKAAIDIVCSSAVASANAVSNTFGIVSALTAAGAIATANAAVPLAAVFATSVSKFTFAKLEKVDELVEEDVEELQVIEAENIPIKDSEPVIEQKLILAPRKSSIPVISELELSSVPEILKNPAGQEDLESAPTEGDSKNVSVEVILDVPKEESEIPSKSVVSPASKTIAPAMFGLFKRATPMKEFKLTKPKDADEFLNRAKLGINLAHPCYQAGEELAKDIDDFIRQVQDEMSLTESVPSEHPTAPEILKQERVDTVVEDASAEMKVIAESAQSKSLVGTSNTTTNPPVGSSTTSSTLKNGVPAEEEVVLPARESLTFSPLTLVTCDQEKSEPEKRDKELGENAASVVVSTVTLLFTRWKSAPLAPMEH